MLKERLEEYVKIINERLDSLILLEDTPDKRLKEAMKYSLMAGGKRLRPALMLEGYRLFKNDYEKALPFACAMEMVHTFSLIHDDLPAIDNDDLRRGKLTNHKVFGESTAILAGDALLNLAYKIISDDLQNLENIECKIKAFKFFSDNAFNMIKGEFVDIDYEGKDISIDQLNYMHDNKTGALIKASLIVGAILAGANDNEMGILGEYAEKIGLTFQIKDDILSETGDEEILGKPIGNDKLRGKSTFVTVLGIDEAKEELLRLTEAAKKILLKLSGKNTDFLSELAVFIKERQN